MHTHDIVLKDTFFNIIILMCIVVLDCHRCFLLKWRLHFLYLFADKMRDLSIVRNQMQIFN